jgi:hypothetical protein
MKTIPALLKGMLVQYVQQKKMLVLNDNPLESNLIVMLIHADTCCVGNGVMIMNATDRYVNASPFVKSLGTIKRVLIVSAAVAYDDPRSGKGFILTIHQALHCLKCRDVCCVLCR